MEHNYCVVSAASSARRVTMEATTAERNEAKYQRLVWLAARLFYVDG